MLPLLGALAVATVERQVIFNILRWGLTTLAASYAAQELKNKDVFGAKPQKEVLNSSLSTSSNNLPAIRENSESGEVVENTDKVLSSSVSPPADLDANSSGVALSASSGDNLLDILKKTGRLLRRGLPGL